MWAEAKAAQAQGRAPRPTRPEAPKPAAPLYTADQFRGLPKFLSGTFSLANVREEAAPGDASSTS